MNVNLIMLNVVCFAYNKPIFTLMCNNTDNSSFDNTFTLVNIALSTLKGKIKREHHLRYSKHKINIHNPWDVPHRDHWSYSQLDLLLSIIMSY